MATRPVGPSPGQSLPLFQQSHTLGTPILESAHLTETVTDDKEGRERLGEQNFEGREKHQSVASHMHPDRRLNPQPTHVP